MVSKFQSNQKTKFILLAVLISFITVIVILLIYLFNHHNQIKKYNNIAESFLSAQKNYSEHISYNELNQALADLRSEESSDEERYTSIILSATYFQDAYYLTNDPKIREYLISIKSDVENLFPNFYDETHIVAACVDPSCGEKPNPEIDKIKNEVNNLNVDKLYKETVLYNLENGIYSPYDTFDQKLNKISLFLLVYNQLLELDNQQASSSAENLKSYVKSRYQKDLSDIEDLRNDDNYPDVIK